VLLMLGELDQGERFLTESLEAAERLVAQDPANNGMRLVVIYVLASHALGYAARSEAQTASLDERTQRLQQAQSYHAQATNLVAQLPSATTRSLPQRGLESTGRRIEEARVQLQGLPR
jgi:hypothetical protein